MRIALVWLAIGCGSKPPPADQTIGHHVPTVAAPTCADVGVILRGPVSSEDAGRAREAEIANACATDKWSPEIVMCVASEKKPQSCLAKLDEKQTRSFNDKLAAWQSQFGGGDYGGDSGDDPPPPPPEIACDEAVTGSDRWLPVSQVKGPDLELARAMRTSALDGLCDADGWDQDVLECVQETKDSASNSNPTTCVPDGIQRTHVTTKLADIDALVGKLDGARKKKPDCKKAVAAHYGDATWKGKVDHIKGRDRMKMITESRAAMTEACIAEKWDDTTRACLVVGGGNDCFVPATKRWGFPAQGVLISTGIPECDAWGVEVKALGKCDKLPQASRDAVQQAYESASSMWLNVPQDQRQTMADACKSVTDAVKQARTSAGCP